MDAYIVQREAPPSAKAAPGGSTELVAGAYRVPVAALSGPD